MQTTKQILVNARKLIENEENWCKDHFAFDRKGMPTSPTNPSADRFCGVGAVCRVMRLSTDVDRIEAMKYMQQFIPLTYQKFGAGFPSFNDCSQTTHADILALFDRAIASFDEPKFDIDTWIDEFKKTLPEITDKRVLVKKNG